MGATMAIAIDKSGRKVRRRIQVGWICGLLLTSCWVFLPGSSPFSVMCLISLSLFVVIKAQTLTSYAVDNGAPNVASVFAWFLLWPGLDAVAFFRPAKGESADRSEWAFALVKAAFGATMFLWAPQVRGINELLAGWFALTGVVFFLHFGTFHLAALAWRHLNRDVRPIMNAPILSTSVNEFWSRRWNRAFRDYASPYLFVPLARMTSPAAAVLIGYVFSGIVHELAISVPAGGGYGLPTLYFGIQGIAVVLERFLLRIGFAITGGARGWIWTAVVVGPAAFLLFHPPFIRRVVLPLLGS